MDLTLIRHAEAGWSASAVARQGPAEDPPLTARGVGQATCLAERAARWKRPNIVLSSPSLRAKQTADPLGAAVGTSVEVAPWLAEVGVHGLATVDATRAAEQIGDDAMSELRARTRTGLGSLLALHGARGSDTPGRWKLTSDQSRIVLVGHGMALAVALEYLLGIESVAWAGHRFQFGHAGFAAVRAYPFAGDWVFGLVRYNEIEHIPREIRTF